MAKGIFVPCKRHGEHSNNWHIASARAFISKLCWTAMCLLSTKPFGYKISNTFITAFAYIVGKCNLVYR